MRNFFCLTRRAYDDEEGVAYIELALSLFVLIIIVFGMVEISAFMRVKNKMNQAADQMGAILGTIPSWRPGLYVEPYIAAAEFMTRPFGVHLAVRYCSGGTNTDVAYNETMAEGDCSLGLGTGGGTPATVECEDAKTGSGGAIIDDNPTVQFVIVKASCHYKPYLNYFKLFDDVMVVSTSVTPMRYQMQW